MASAQLVLSGLKHARLTALTGLTLAVMALAAVTAPAPAAAEILIRFGTALTAGQATFNQVVDACRRIEAESGGAVKIDIRPINEFGKPNELLGMVDKGTLEAAYTVQGYHEGRFAASSVMEMPLLRKTSLGGTRALWDLYGNGHLTRDYQDLKVLGMWMLPAYGIFTGERKIDNVRRLRGLRIRAPGETAGRALTVLGSVPVSLPLNLMGFALANDLIDGVAYGWYSSTTTPGIEGKKLMDQVQYLLDVSFAGPVVMLAMRKSVFDGLPPAVRTAIDRHTGRELSERIAEERDSFEANIKEKMASDGVHTVVRFTDTQLAEMQTALDDVYQEWVSDVTKLGVDGKALLTAAQGYVRTHEK